MSKVTNATADDVFVAAGPARPAVTVAPGDELDVDAAVAAELVASGAFTASSSSSSGKSTSKSKSKSTKITETPDPGKGDTAA